MRLDRRDRSVAAGPRAQQRRRRAAPARARARHRRRPASPSQPSFREEPGRRPVEEVGENRVRICACAGRPDRGRAPRRRRRCRRAVASCSLAPLPRLLGARAGRARFGRPRDRRAEGRARRRRREARLPRRILDDDRDDVPAAAERGRARLLPGPGRGSRRGRRESCRAAALAHGRALEPVGERPRRGGELGFRATGSATRADCPVGRVQATSSPTKCREPTRPRARNALSATSRSAQAQHLGAWPARAARAAPSPGGGR